MKIKIHQPASIQEIGGRKNQEDAMFPLNGEARDTDTIFIVCDGMGGHEHGAVASTTVSRALAEYLHDNYPADGYVSDELLRTALLYAYKVLDTKDTGAESKMGTTLTLICLHRGGVSMAYIGDSRIYHIRRQDGERILYKSRDHSLVYELFLSGEITREEMKTHPHKNIITRAVQPGLENRVRMEIVHTTDVLPDDCFFMCTDGVLENMNDAELLQLLCSEESDAEKCERIRDLTKNNSDNHTALLLRVAEVQRESGDDAQPNDEAEARSNALNLENHKHSASPTPPPADSGTQQKAPSSKWLYIALIAAAAAILAAIALLI